jgi:hypothetical protein
MYQMQECPARRFFSMSSTTLYRWSGFVLLIGSLIGIAGTILDTVINPGHNLTAQQVLSTSFTIDASLFLVWSVLLVMGLPGPYLRQATRAGGLGFAGFVLLSLGLLLGGVAFGIVQVTDWPYLAQSAPKLLPSGGTGPTAGFLLWIAVPLLLLGLGSILLGIATLRAKVFSRWIGILLIVAGVLFLVSFAPIPFIDLVNNLVFFIAFAWFGYALVSQDKEAVPMQFAPTEAQVSR